MLIIDGGAVTLAVGVGVGVGGRWVVRAVVECDKCVTTESFSKYQVIQECG